MDLTIDSPTLGDLTSVPWEEVIDTAAERDCWRYCGDFCAKAAEVEKAGDRQALAVYVLLAHVTSLVFRLDAKDAPIGPPERLDSFSDAELLLLASMLPTIRDPELRARVADILWLRNYGEQGRRDFQIGRLATAAYLESARHLEDPVHWPHCRDRAERALQIAASLGRSAKNQLYADVIAYIEEVLDRCNGEDPHFLSAEMMDLLQGQRQGNSAKYAALAEKAARRAETEHAWFRARPYWQVKARWHELTKDETQRRVALLAGAETYVQEAEDRIQGEHPSCLTAAAFLQDAIEALRQIGGTQERVEELHKRLLRYQEKGIAEMGVFSASAPIENAEAYLDHAREQVRDKRLPDALLALANVASPQRVDVIERHVKEIARKTPLQDIFATTLVNARGRTQKRIPSSSSDATRDALEARMFPYAAQLRGVIVLTSIEPAREQVNLEHNVRVRDFAPIVLNNPFVPSGREGIFARGLHAGLTGDFLVAAHLLIPQLDNSIRTLVERRGEIVSGLETDGTQPERGLNTTLAHPEATQILGADVIFDLRGLLVEKTGSNMRHETAHGLLDEGTFMTAEAAYVWWITLHLCCIPVLNRLWQQAREHESQATAQHDSDTPAHRG